MENIAMSPLKIEILLWYYYAVEDYPKIGLQIVDDALEEFCKANILIKGSTTEKTNRKYIPNHEPLHMYIKSLLNVPLPTQMWYQKIDFEAPPIQFLRSK